MNRGQLITRFRLLEPNAKLSVVSNAKAQLLLNEAVEEVNQVAHVYKGSTTNGATIGKQTYQLSVDFPNYAGAEKGGVWITDDNSKFFRVIPKTKEWFDDNLQNWWESSNAMPEYYFIDGDDLTFDSPFDSVRSIRVHHLLKTTSMTSDSNYPWNNSTTQIHALRPLDNAIVMYAVREVQHALGKKGDYAAKDAEYQTKLRRGMRRIRRRPDFTSDFSAGMTFE